LILQRTLWKDCSAITMGATFIYKRFTWSRHWITNNYVEAQLWPYTTWHNHMISMSWTVGGLVSLKYETACDDRQLA
jgi:hypothetical protein